jgi:4-diphosphocytidyl-2-C-methyl-D-erythritol kinase
MSLRALYDLPAPAKINLFLHVVGRRADGYHLLQSPFVLIDWADTLHFERRDDGRLVRHDLSAELPADDLCLRAARSLQAASGTALGADISILKSVPWGAGMGGGSSDAATTLLALNRLWGLNWRRERLAALGLQLGADVPFFVGGHNAFVEGIGERMTAMAWPQRHYAVAKPPQAIATREIFEHPALKRDSQAVIVEGSPEEAGSSGVPAGWLQEFDAGYGRNDLQAPAEDRCPEVAQAARWLEARYGNSRMTGSGSAVFARVGTAKPPEQFEATQPDAALQGLPTGWVGRMCRSLVQHPLGAWAD